MEHSPLFWIFNIAVVTIASALTIYSARARKGAGGYLCEDCRFNSPEACLKSVRPFALVCTSYRQINDGHALVVNTSATIAISSAASSAASPAPASATSGPLKEEEE
jgi:hypothetical protein